MRVLTLDDTIFVLENCTKRNDSKCNLCILNDEYGDSCIQIKDVNALQLLKSYEQKLENERRQKKFGGKNNEK